MKTLISFAVAVLISSTFCSVAVAQDAAAGAKKAQMCTGCHNIPGYQASFPEIHKVPMIAGQSAGYIVAALTAYQKDERKHPTMKGIAVTLTEQDMADLAAYYAATVGPAVPASLPAPSARVAELVKKANCTSCHGENYSQPIAPNYPKIAGQHSDYLYVALKAYQTDGKALVGRKNAVMSGMARQFTHAELKELAVYIGSLPGELQTVQQSSFR
jgi:cytochrome c553